MKEGFYEKDITIKTCQDSAFAFITAEESIFWAVNLLQHKYDGGVTRASLGGSIKGFEPIDVLLPMWRLIRERKLSKHHEAVLTSYGLGGALPLEGTKDYKVWNEALEALRPLLIKKNIIHN